MPPREAAQQEHGRGRLGADRDRAGAVRGVHAVGVHHRHLGPVLPAVRPDHRRRDGDFADRVADAVAGDVRAAAEAARRRAHRDRWWERPIHGFFGLFNRGFDGIGAGVSWLRHAQLVRRAAIDGRDLSRRASVSASIAFRKTPVGFIPQVDRGYLIVVRAAAARRLAGAHRRGAAACARHRPRRARRRRTPSTFAGFYGATFTNAPNAGAIFLVLDPFEQARPRSAPVGAGDPGRAAPAAVGASRTPSSSPCCRRRCRASAPPAASA